MFAIPPPAPASDYLIVALLAIIERALLYFVVLHAA